VARVAAILIAAGAVIVHVGGDCETEAEAEAAAERDTETSGH
jgi:hypothetical protein